MQKIVECKHEDTKQTQQNKIISDRTADDYKGLFNNLHKFRIAAKVR